MSQAEMPPPFFFRGRAATRSTVLAAFVVGAAAVSCASTDSAERPASLSQAETPDTFGIGSGRDGDFTAPAGATVVNSYAPITTVSAGATQLTIGAVQGAAAGFVADDLVLVWHTTGLAAVSGVQTAIALAGDVGAYEFARVKSVAAGVVTVTNPLSGAARFATGSQLVRVPEYRTLTVGAGASVTPYAWDGSSGGIVVLFATVTVANAGAIRADASGFRGGGIENAAVQPGCTSLDNWSNAVPVATCGGAHKGEGLFPSAYAVANLAAPGAGPAMTYGRGNYANGAGGGDAHNSGGGGGGHAGVGGMGGRTWVGDVNGGGPRFVGGLGGAPIAYTLTDRLVLGGGGGAGEENNNVGTSGAAGGGVVLIRAASLTGVGSVSATGGSVALVAGGDGCGGGGAGGAVLIEVQGAAACASATANGGSGGTGGTNPNGPGGGGAGGYVLVRAASGACPATAAGGANGTTTTADPMYAGTAYGATAGAVGSATPAAGVGFSGAVCTFAIIGGNQCGGCVVDVDCAAAQPLCDATKNTCGTCTSSNLTACTGATPTCDTTPTHDICAGCNGNFGSAATRACPTAANGICVTTGPNAGSCGACVVSATCANPKPVCSSSNVCVVCDGDNATMAPNPCPTTANPYCQSTGACGTCTNDASCGAGHAGPFCNTTSGACGNTCTTDAQCPMGSWCNNLAGPGLCTPKTINGQLVPGGSCIAMIALRACVSGVCDPDNACGHANGIGPCTAQTAASVCRSGSCDLATGNCGGLGDGGMDAGDSGDASGIDAGDAGDGAIADAPEEMGNDGSPMDGGADGGDASGLVEAALGDDSSSPDAPSAVPADTGIAGGTIAGGGLSCSTSTRVHGGDVAPWALLVGLGAVGRLRRRAQGRR
jgi:hypothetical protein